MSTKKLNPVVLVHGIWDTRAVFDQMAASLTQEGYSVHSLNLTPNDATVGLENLAGQVADYIGKTFEENQPLNLVGFSMGGLVSRYYVQRLQGLKRVEQLITISSPHYGTMTAYVRDLPGYVQMRPGSEFLLDLQRDMMILDQIHFTSLWTPWDVMIIPATSSKMPVGKNIEIKVLVHSLMLTNPDVIRCVIDILS